MSIDIEYENIDQTGWAEPVSMEEAQSRRQSAATEVANIQAQLGNNGMDENGYTMSYPDYQDWKRRAKYALSYKMKELRRLNTWIKEYRSAQPVPDDLAEMTTPQLVSHAMNVLRSVLRELESRIENGGEA